MASIAPPPWVDLPRDITVAILHKLGAIQIMTSAQMVCKTWRSVCLDPAMWRAINMRNDVRCDGILWEAAYDLEKMCRNAVDRSQGQLVDLSIEFFGTDNLLNYIAERYGTKILNLLNQFLHIVISL